MRHIQHITSVSKVYKNICNIFVSAVLEKNLLHFLFIKLYKCYYHVSKSKLSGAFDLKLQKNDNIYLSSFENKMLFSRSSDTYQFFILRRRMVASTPPKEGFCE